MKKYIALALLLLSFSGFAQNSINNYKNVLVPEKFSFLKQANQYKLNALTKSFLEEQGFTAYFDNSDLPTDIANNKCSALSAEVVEKKSMFVTKLTLLLKDCKGNVLFKSKEGTSREKEYTVSYTLALQDAFTSLAEAKYVYTPQTGDTTVLLLHSSGNPATTSTTPIVSASPAVSVPAAAPQTTGTLYAQPTATGYQLIDTTPKKVLTLYKSSTPNYFIADNGTTNGLVFKSGDNWLFEYYKDGKLMSEKLSIKF